MMKKYVVYGVVSAVTANEEIEAKNDEQAEKIFREMFAKEETYEKDFALDAVYVEAMPER